LERLAHGQNSLNERLDAIGKARLINQMLGAPVVTPWDLDMLDDIWMDTIMDLIEVLPAKKERIKAEEQLFREFEAKHSTYGKNLRN
jgi:hypothetical protein